MGMLMRPGFFAMILVVAAPALFTALTAPAVMARVWKPTPAQMAQDYTVINHNKGTDGRVVIQWVSSPGFTAPTMQQLLDKYVVINIVRTRQAPTGLTTWDDVEGVQVSDSKDQPLKEVTPAAMPPTLIGFMAQVDATVNQSTQGKAKTKWLVFEAGGVNACTPGRLSVVYEGETYTFDTPIPGCPKS
jgi:hypothetical protein